MAEIKTYSCRKKGTKRWRVTEALDPVDAASCFAEEWGLEDGDVVEVKGTKGKGEFRIEVRTDWYAEMVK